jgi:hypothetical protein
MQHLLTSVDTYEYVILYIGELVFMNVLNIDMRTWVEKFICYVYQQKLLYV